MGSNGPALPPCTPSSRPRIPTPASFSFSFFSRLRTSAGWRERRKRRSRAKRRPPAPSRAIPMTASGRRASSPCGSKNRAGIRERRHGRHAASAFPVPRRPGPGSVPWKFAVSARSAVRPPLRPGCSRRRAGMDFPLEAPQPSPGRVSARRPARRQAPAFPRPRPSGKPQRPAGWPPQTFAGFSGEEAQRTYPGPPNPVARQGGKSGEAPRRKPVKPAEKEKPCRPGGTMRHNPENGGRRREGYCHPLRILL